MNLRRITLRYMGWCPGIQSAARFLPDVEIPMTSKVLATIIVSFLGILAVSYASYYQRSQIPEGPLKIYIGKHGKVVIYDRDFNETFDYAGLWGSEWEHREWVFFREGFNASENAPGPEIQYENMTMDALEDVLRYMEENLTAPRVVAGMTGFLLNQTFEETYRQIWDTPLSPTRKGFATHMGDFPPLGASTHPAHGVYYNVDRLRDRYGEDGNRSDIQDGVSIKKNSEDGWVWEVRIDAAEFFLQELFPSVVKEPRYKVQLIRYPEGFEGFYRPPGL